MYDREVLQKRQDKDISKLDEEIKDHIELLEQDLKSIYLPGNKEVREECKKLHEIAKNAYSKSKEEDDDNEKLKLLKKAEEALKTIDKALVIASDELKVKPPVITKKTSSTAAVPQKPKQKHKAKIETSETIEVNMSKSRTDQVTQATKVLKNLTTQLQTITDHNKKLGTNIPDALKSEVAETSEKVKTSSEKIKNYTTKTQQEIKSPEGKNLEKTIQNGNILVKEAQTIHDELIKLSEKVQTLQQKQDVGVKVQPKVAPDYKGAMNNANNVVWDCTEKHMDNIGSLFKLSKMLFEFQESSYTTIEQQKEEFTNCYVALGGTEEDAQTLLSGFKENKTTNLIFEAFDSLNNIDVEKQVSAVIKNSTEDTHTDIIPKLRDFYEKQQSANNALGAWSREKENSTKQSTYIKQQKAAIDALQPFVNPAIYKGLSDEAIIGGFVLCGYNLYERLGNAAEKRLQSLELEQKSKPVQTKQPDLTEQLNKEVEETKAPEVTNAKVQPDNDQITQGDDLLAKLAEQFQKISNYTEKLELKIPQDVDESAAAMFQSLNSEVNQQRESTGLISKEISTFLRDFSDVLKLFEESTPEKEQEIEEPTSEIEDEINQKLLEAIEKGEGLITKAKNLSFEVNKTIESVEKLQVTLIELAANKHIKLIEQVTQAIKDCKTDKKLEDLRNFIAEANKDPTDDYLVNSRLALENIYNDTEESLSADNIKQLAGIAKEHLKEFSSQIAKEVANAIKKYKTPEQLEQLRDFIAEANKDSKDLTKIDLSACRRKLNSIYEDREEGLSADDIKQLAGIAEKHLNEISLRLAEGVINKFSDVDDLLFLRNLINDSKASKIDDCREVLKDTKTQGLIPAHLGRLSYLAETRLAVLSEEEAQNKIQECDVNDIKTLSKFITAVTAKEEPDLTACREALQKIYDDTAIQGLTALALKDLSGLAELKVLELKGNKDLVAHLINVKKQITQCDDATKLHAFIADASNKTINQQTLENIDCDNSDAEPVFQALGKDIKIENLTQHVKNQLGEVVYIDVITKLKNLELDQLQEIFVAAENIANGKDAANSFNTVLINNGIDKELLTDISFSPDQITDISDAVKSFIQPSACEVIINAIDNNIFFKEFKDINKLQAIINEAQAFSVNKEDYDTGSFNTVLGDNGIPKDFLRGVAFSQDHVNKISFAAITKITKLHHSELLNKINSLELKQLQDIITSTNSSDDLFKKLGNHVYHKENYFSEHNIIFNDKEEIDGIYAALSKKITELTLTKILEKIKNFDFDDREESRKQLQELYENISNGGDNEFVYESLSNNVLDDEDYFSKFNITFDETKFEQISNAASEKITELVLQDFLGYYEEAQIKDDDKEELEAIIAKANAIENESEAFNPEDIKELLISEDIGYPDEDLVGVSFNQDQFFQIAEAAKTQLAYIQVRDKIKDSSLSLEQLQNIIEIVDKKSISKESVEPVHKDLNNVSSFSQEQKGAIKEAVIERIQPLACKAIINQINANSEITLANLKAISNKVDALLRNDCTAQAFKTILQENNIPKNLLDHVAFGKNEANEIKDAVNAKILEHTQANALTLVQNTISSSNKPAELKNFILAAQEKDATIDSCRKTLTTISPHAKDLAQSADRTELQNRATVRLPVASLNAAQQQINKCDIKRITNFLKAVEPTEPPSSLTLDQFRIALRDNIGYDDTQIQGLSTDAQKKQLITAAKTRKQKLEQIANRPRLDDALTATQLDALSDLKVHLQNLHSAGDKIGYIKNETNNPQMLPILKGLTKTIPSSHPLHAPLHRLKQQLSLGGQVDNTVAIGNATLTVVNRYALTAEQRNTLSTLKTALDSPATQAEEAKAALTTLTAGANQIPNEHVLRTYLNNLNTELKLESPSENSDLIHDHARYAVNHFLPSPDVKPVELSKQQKDDLRQLQRAIVEERKPDELLTIINPLLGRDKIGESLDNPSPDALSNTHPSYAHLDNYRQQLDLKVVKKDELEAAKQSVISDLDEIEAVPPGFDTAPLSNDHKAQLFSKIVKVRAALKSIIGNNNVDDITSINNVDVKKQKELITSLINLLKPEISEIDTDCEINLMSPPPRGGQYEDSDRNTLYLYKENNGKIFYRIEGENQYLDKKSSSLLQGELFNSTSNDNNKIREAVLDFTSRRGHTTQPPFLNPEHHLHEDFKKMLDVFLNPDNSLFEAIDFKGTEEEEKEKVTDFNHKIIPLIKGLDDLNHSLLYIENDSTSNGAFKTNTNTPGRYTVAANHYRLVAERATKTANGKYELENTLKACYKMLDNLNIAEGSLLYERDTMIPLTNYSNPTAKTNDQGKINARLADINECKKTLTKTIWKYTPTPGRTIDRIACFSKKHKVLYSPTEEQIENQVKKFLGSTGDSVKIRSAKDKDNIKTSPAFRNGDARINQTELYAMVARKVPDPANLGAKISEQRKATVASIQRVKNGVYESEIRYNSKEIRSYESKDFVKWAVTEIENYCAGTSRNIPMEILGKKPEELVKALVTVCKLYDIKVKGVDYVPTAKEKAAVEKIIMQNDDILDKVTGKDIKALLLSKLDVSNAQVMTKTTPQEISKVKLPPLPTPGYGRGS